ncbi:MAG: hypothetical protein ABR499_01550 [Gemmatimonadaceae bacterium]
MPVREFVDSSGVKWRVWNTRPSRGEMLSGEFEHGWLTFESATSLRRCTPIPRDWESASLEQLELMCRAATETRRQSPSGGTPAVGGGESTPEQDARR